MSPTTKALRCVLFAVATICIHASSRADTEPDLSKAKTLSRETDRCGRHGVRVTNAISRMSGPAVLTNESDVSVFVVGTPEIRWTCEEGNDSSDERTRCPHGTNIIKMQRGEDRLLTTTCMNLQASAVEATSLDYRAKKGFSFENTNAFKERVGGYGVDDLLELYDKCEVYEFACAAPGPLTGIYLGIMNAALNSGQCFGFSLASLMIGNGHMPLHAFPGFVGTDESKRGNAKDVWHLVGPSLSESGKDNASPKLTHYVHLQHMLQMSSESAHAFAGEFFSMKTPQGFKQRLKKLIKQGGAIVSVQEGTHGHAVVAYDIKDTKGGGYDVLIYNSNAAWDPKELSDEETRKTNYTYSHIAVTAEGRFSLKQPAKHHSYEGPMTGIAAVPLSLYVNEKHHIPTSLVGLWDVVFGDVGSGPDGVVKTVQIRDDSGHMLFKPDGTFNDDPRTRLPGSIPMPALEDDKQGRFFILDGKGTYTHTVAGRASGRYHARFVGRHLGVEIEDVPAQPGVLDSLSLNPRQATVELKTAAAEPKPFHARLHARGSDKSTRTISIQGNWSKNAPVRFGFDATRNAVIYKHLGQAATLNVGFSASHASGSTTMPSVPVKVELGDVITFKPNWSTLQTNPGNYTIRRGVAPETSQPLRI